MASGCQEVGAADGEGLWLAAITFLTTVPMAQQLQSTRFMRLVEESGIYSVHALFCLIMPLARPPYSSNPSPQTTDTDSTSIQT